MNRQFLLKLIFLVTSISQSLGAADDTFHIVTSLSSPCPEKVNGETCLTLQQYAIQVGLYASGRPNTTLILESGQHEIDVREFHLLLRGDFDNFTMVSTSAQVIVKVEYQLYYYTSSYTRFRLYIRGICFIRSNGGHEYLIRWRIYNTEDVIIESCAFFGVTLTVRDVSTVVILKSCFSNGNITHPGDSYFQSFLSESLTINETFFITNRSSSLTSNYDSRLAVVHIEDSRRSVVISGTMFVNNTSGALSIISGSYGSVVLISNIFFNNHNIEGYFAALFITRKHADISIVNTTFVYNSANYSSCGSFRIVDSSVNIVDSMFYYNWAHDDGGAGCITNGNLSISNSNFIQNFATGVGGALTSDNSSVTITKSVFRNNVAVYSGGALSTYVLSSDYIITRSSFIGNRAGGDGGAILVGRHESHLRVEDSTFSNNQATERGGAIAIFGSRMIMITTNIYDNEAAFGKSISACSSEVATSISLAQGQRDSFCTNYDSSIDHHYLTSAKEHSLPSNVNLGITMVCFKKLTSDNGIHGELKTTAAVSYTALTVSITLVIAVLLYVVITKAVPQIRRQQNGTENEVEIQDEPEPEPEYEEANVHANVDHIEMVPNVVYGSHGAAN